MLANICSKERWGNPFLRRLVAHLSVLIPLGFISINKWLKIHLSVTMLNIVIVFGTTSSYFPSHTHAPIEQELRKVIKWDFTFRRLPSSCDTLFPEAELLHSASVGLRLSRDEKSSFPLSPMCQWGGRSLPGAFSSSQSQGDVWRGSPSEWETWLWP